MSLVRELWRGIRSFLPQDGFFFERPIVVLQSDDWARVGLRDQEGLEELRKAGVALGDSPYDFYTLETADDLAAVRQLLKRHRDATGRPACLGMNFVTANLDFARIAADGFRQIHLRPLSDGLPDRWDRPGLIDAYRAGIEEAVFFAALHGTTHFCRSAVERHLAAGGERAALLRKFWEVGTPYIYWRMPWIGYEYWDPEPDPDERFLSAASQSDLVGSAVGAFTRFFSTLPKSACAPGYRANRDTHRAWAQVGVRVVQNGPGTKCPPHFDEFNLLHLYRSLDFEPALADHLSVADCVRVAGECFARGIPAVVSMHSINLHSTVKDFRSRTLPLLDEFLSALETKYPDLLYLNDGDLFDLVNTGSYPTESRIARVTVTKRKFSRRSLRAS